ncbi:MAG TPA: PGPGW domain-containing protein [Rubrobacter sp.]|nr:PGPGW domain-containing protein [Rubrobacter sp.]
MGHDHSMIKSLKGNWEEFKEGKPGERFKDRYQRRQQEPGHIVKRIVLVVLGAVIAVGSLFTAPLPGPGFATVFIGLAILAGELLPAARFLDWSEIRLRKLWRFVGDVWRTGPLGKAAVMLVAAFLAAAFLYVAYRLLLG